MGAPSFLVFTPSTLRSLPFKLSPLFFCSSALKHPSLSQVLPSTLSNFEVLSYQTHFLGGISIIVRIVLYLIMGVHPR